MPLPEINSITQKQLSDFASRFFNQTIKVPQNLSERYAKVSTALVWLSKKELPEEIREPYYKDLEDLPALLAEKNEEGKTVGELLTADMDDKQKASFVIKITNVFNKLEIKGNAIDLMYPGSTLTVGNESYDREAFRQKMYANNWEKGADDKIIDKMYDAFVMTSINMKAKRSEYIDNMKKAREAMGTILKTPIVKGLEKSGKKALVDKLVNNNVVNSPFNNADYSYLTEYSNSITPEMVARETHTVEKAEFIKNAKENGFNRKEDEAFLEAVFEGRFDNEGKYDSAYDRSVVRNISVRTAKTAQARSNIIKDVKEKLEKIPEEKRSEANKKALAEIANQEIAVQEIAKQEQLDKDASAFYKEVHNANFHDCWMDNQSVYHYLYKAGTELPKDHEFNKQLENMRKGLTLQNPEFNIKEDERFSILQTNDELEECKRLLEGDNPEALSENAKKAIEGINRFQNNFKASIERERADKPVAIYMETVIRDNENAIVDFLNELDHRENRDTLPENFIKVRDALNELISAQEMLFGAYDNKKIADARKVVEENMAGVVGGLGKEDPMYEKGLAILQNLCPDQVELAKEAADDFAIRKSNMQAINDTLFGVHKAYFNHDNSPEYQRMVNAVIVAITATNTKELDDCKTELVESAKEYLKHTGLGRASKYHDNAEMRRLCAFRIIAEVGSPEEMQDIVGKANALRADENKISKERLDKLVIQGGKMRVSAKDLLKEEKENFKKEQKTKKENVKKKNGPEIGINK